MCIHGGLFVCFRKECSAAQLLAYASRRLLSMPIVVVQSCFLPLIFFFYFRVPLSVTDNKIGRTYISSIRVVHAVLGEESQQELNYSVCGVLCLFL